MDGNLAYADLSLEKNTVRSLKNITKVVQANMNRLFSNILSRNKSILRVVLS
jgi:hypothetical protein